MSVTLLADQCPPPQYRTAHLSIAAATSGANAPVSTPITAGSPVGFVGKLNSNQTRQDLTGAFGGGGYFVAEGLTLSAADLIVNVASGTAMIDGPVGVDVVQTLAVPASNNRIWIWLQQNGISTYTTTTNPPAQPACLLGSCVTSANAVTSTDTSGVLYGLGILQRTTADAGMPKDTPPTGLHFLTQTMGGLYYWNGAVYTSIADPPGSIVVSLAPSVQTFPAAGKNYLVTANFSAAGVFADAFYESSCAASNASLTVSPNENGRTAGAMSWIVYVPSDQGNNLANIALTASLRGRGWSGSSTSGVAGNWTVTQIV